MDATGLGNRIERGLKAAAIMLIVIGIVLGLVIAAIIGAAM